MPWSPPRASVFLGWQPKLMQDWKVRSQIGMRVLQSIIDHAQQILDNLWDEEHGKDNHAELWLRFAENLSVAETAGVAGLPQPHVKILVFRARRRLLKAPFTP